MQTGRHRLCTIHVPLIFISVDIAAGGDDGGALITVENVVGRDCVTSGSRAEFWYFPMVFWFDHYCFCSCICCCSSDIVISPIVVQCVHL